MVVARIQAKKQATFNGPRLACTVNGFARIEFSPAYQASRNAAVAARYPHIPCTPPPGGVDDEQR